ncbi:MAG: nicotinate (nicotinamide) nucleotide adenylyltransferase [Candidatus Levybacteria bacterium RIFCSPHIGHO2_02_FULL_37_13]|nr:MAG: nicotinate (nicotinamide) nucleotide adenylyltransferase [Candidatus Levybacteria bacterium RIFCSPHIGHO2_02_FULL_37_13]
MVIGILGGSFDPPHIGHYFVIQQILELRKEIDKILLVPAYQHQWKPAFASVEDRKNMLQHFTGNRVEISDIETQRKGISYTIDTIKQLKTQTEAELYWIVGSDIVYEFERWEKKDELIKEARFLVFPRDPYHLPKKLPFGFECVQDKNLITTNISSTIVRQRVKEKKDISYLVPEKVEKYIIEHGLYS